MAQRNERPMLELAALAVAILFAGACLGSWRRGLVVCLLVGMIQDPLRKMVPGQPVKVNVIVANRGTGEVAIKQVRFVGFAGDSACTMTERASARRP